MSVSYPITDSALRWLERIFAERFGHAWRLSRSHEGLQLCPDGASGSIVFDSLCPGFADARSNQSYTTWDAERESWKSILGGRIPAPGVASLPSPLIEQLGVKVVVHYDIPGLVYWMFARVEEIERTDLDEHQRFSASAAHACVNDYIERPVVDEWLDVLSQIIKRTWPSLRLKQHHFVMRLSHDVDRPSRYAFSGFRQVGRNLVGDLLKRGNLRSALSAPLIRFSRREHLHPLDIYNTFDWIMTTSERYGLESAFYFICGRTDALRDGDYAIDHPLIRNLLRSIATRGHEIGLHPSYGTYMSSELVSAEAKRLREICAAEGIYQDSWGGRMHYLRWHQPTTMRAWEAASMTYDSTLTYAERPGFRCGTCFDYPAFDPVEQEIMQLRIRPLIAMEGSILSSRYMGYGQEAALHKFLSLKDRCRAVKGSFSLLWHNSELCSSGAKKLYECVISG